MVGSEGRKEPETTLSMPGAPTLRRMYGDGREPLWADVDLCIIEEKVDGDCYGATPSSKSFKAHKSVLTAASPYFDYLFTMNRSDEACRTGRTTVSLPGEFFSAESLAQILQMIYGGEILLNGETIYEIHGAANYLQLDYICLKCVQYIAEKVSIVNWVPSFRYAQKDTFSGTDRILANCNEVLKENFKEISCQPTFLSLQWDELLMILKSVQGQKKVPRLQILDAYLGWLAFDLPQRWRFADCIVAATNPLNIDFDVIGKKSGSVKELITRDGKTLPEKDLIKKVVSRFSEAESGPSVSKVPRLEGDETEDCLSRVSMKKNVYFVSYAEKGGDHGFLVDRYEATGLSGRPKRVLSFDLGGEYRNLLCGVYNYGSVILVSSGCWNSWPDGKAIGLQLIRIQGHKISRHSFSLPIPFNSKAWGYLELKGAMSAEYLCIIAYGNWRVLRYVFVYTYWFSHTGDLVTHLEWRWTPLQLQPHDHARKLKLSSMIDPFMSQTGPKLYLPLTTQHESETPVMYHEQMVRILNLRDFKWTDGPNLPYSAICGASAVQGRNWVYISGGWLGEDNPCLGTVAFLDYDFQDRPADRYDYTWTSLPSMDIVRAHHLMVACADRLIIMAGGNGTDYLKSAEELDLNDTTRGWIEQTLLEGVRPELAIVGD